jgi:5-methylcytosine-specific restriction endonuclease McrA
MKICSKCGVPTPLKEFYRENGRARPDCKRCVSQVKKNHYRKNRVSILRKRGICYRQNPRKFLDRRKEWGKRNPEYIREYQRRPDRRLYSRSWKKRNPRLKPPTKADCLFVIERDKSTCQYCFKELAPKEVSMDHILPLSRRGTNDRENLCVACLPCNVKKSNKIVAPLGDQTSSTIVVRPRMQMFEVSGKRWIMVPRRLLNG